MGYIVAWSIGDEKDCIDNWQIFCDEISETKNEADALAFYEALLENEDLYTATIAKVQDSTEPHYIKW